MKNEPHCLEIALAGEQRELLETKSIEEIYKAFRDTLDAYLPQLREHLMLLREVQKRASKTTADRPMVLIGAAFLAGLALGMVLSRRRN
jgi:ElaB/YqjD/DUF883 family membrane-anchored ribosome-binding protein